MHVDHMDPAALTAAIRLRTEQFLMQNRLTWDLRLMARFLEYATEYIEYADRGEDAPSGACEQFEDAFVAALGFNDQEHEHSERSWALKCVGHAELEQVRAIRTLLRHWRTLGPILTAAIESQDDDDALKLALAALTTEKAEAA